MDCHDSASQNPAREIFFLDCFVALASLRAPRNDRFGVDCFVVIADAQTPRNDELF
ncbi:hypothetical protein ACWIUD_03890 [Helicobacter sp. 23-1044]